MSGINRRVSELMAAAWYAEAAEAAGVHAPELLADPKKAVHVLGGPASVPAARNAVVQHFGTVGALMVVACEEASMRASRDAAFEAARAVGDEAVGVIAGTSGDTDTPVVDGLLCRLLEGFSELGPSALYNLVEAIEHDDAVPEEDEACRSRRRLNVAYAIAARDGTTEAHRAYVEALDRVLDSTRPLVAS